jgi:hypothetical protein
MVNNPRNNSMAKPHPNLAMASHLLSKGTEVPLKATVSLHLKDMVRLHLKDMVSIHPKDTTSILAGSLHHAHHNLPSRKHQLRHPRRQVR